MAKRSRGRRARLLARNALISETLEVVARDARVIATIFRESPFGRVTQEDLQ